MNDLKVGQTLVLKIRYNNLGDTAATAHPYLIVDIDSELGVVEIAQLDSLAGKEYKAAFRSNKVIYCDNPKETVIDKDSYIQLDNKFMLENCPDLSRFRRQTDQLSPEKLEDVLRAYRSYHRAHHIDENKNVYMNKEEVLSLNRTRGVR